MDKTRSFKCNTTSSSERHEKWVAVKGYIRALTIVHDMQAFASKVAPDSFRVLLGLRLGYSEAGEGQRSATDKKQSIINKPNS